jgi:hypothetical protein
MPWVVRTVLIIWSGSTPAFYFFKKKQGALRGVASNATYWVYKWHMLSCFSPSKWALKFSVDYFKQVKCSVQMDGTLAVGCTHCSCDQKEYERRACAWTQGPLDACGCRNRIHLCLPFALHLIELQWAEQSTQGSTSSVLRQDDWSIG